MERTTTVVRLRGGDETPWPDTVGEDAVTRWATPDGWVFAFSGFGDALTAVVALLTGPRWRSGDTAPAVGIDVGDVDVRQAPEIRRGPWARAEELCRLAAPGQVLCSEIARLLMGERADVELHPVDGHAGCFELVASDRVGVALVVPAPLAGQDRHPLIERSEAWAALCNAAGANGGAGHVLLAGEAGSGKTRLLAEFARHRGDPAVTGAPVIGVRMAPVVLYGAAPERSQAPFQPFLEALRPPIEALGPERLAQLMPPGTQQALARVLPIPIGMDRGVGADPGQGSRAANDADTVGDAGDALNPGESVEPGDRPSSDLETVRYWGFEAVVDLLNAIATLGPVRLLLDDLHWAGSSTVALLEHIMRSARLGPVTVVAAYRDTPGDQSGAFATVVGELARRPSIHRCVLHPFGAEAVRDFVADAVHRPELPEELVTLAATLAETTGGNAFLLTESWRHLIETNRVRLDGERWWVAPGRLDTPRSVQELTERRLALLPDAGQELIRAAACAGSRFDLGVVAGASDQSLDVALDLMGRAAAVGLVTSMGSGRFSFAHALVRQAIEDALGPAARPRHHLALARAYQRLRPEQDVVLAHHFAAAVPLVGPESAARYALIAAARLAGTVANDHAVAVLEEVLGVTEDPASRLALLVVLAQARATAGASLDASRTCAEAVAIARDLGDDAGLVRAALVMAEATWRGAFHGGSAAALLREALEVATDPIERIKLQGGLSAALALSGRDQQSAVTAAAALEAARGTGQSRLILDTIHLALYADMKPPVARQQLQTVLEGIEVAEGLGDEEAQLHLVCKALLRLMVVADAPLLAREMHRLDRLAAKFRQPYYLLVQSGMHGTVALSEGRFGDAEAAIDRYQHWAEVNQQPDSGYGIQMFSLRREQGRLGELRPALELAARMGREQGAWGPGLAAVYAEVGMNQDAARLLDRLCASDGVNGNGNGADGSGETGGEVVPDDSLRPAVLSYLADAAWATGHRPAAELVARLLGPYRGLMVYVPGLACYGAADRYLGRVAEVLGRTRAARSHFEDALALDRATGWSTWIAHSGFALGAHLLVHGTAEDRSRADQLLTEAAETARSLGMASLTARCAELAASAPPAGTNAATARPDSPLDPRPLGRAQVGLTAKELEVLALVALGRSNRQIGAELHSSMHTVANHVRSILAKTGCANRTEAAAWAHAAGMVLSR
ncbi:MAG: helix-turn-helix transcriptional regulator [Acidimicrobiales bacterium]